VKIYTRTGDGGETGLFGAGRVPKDHPRVEAYGAVDEANAVIGVALAHEEDPAIGGMLVEIQAQLFDLGALLATPAESKAKGAPSAIAPERIAQLESWIDAAEAELPALRSFILPGGGCAAASLHHARTVVRRAERRTVTLIRTGAVDRSALVYLNRLSDLLFVLARLSNRRAGEPETRWQSRTE
jgi:cob(I)alamin adenosyltransferase